MLKYRIYYFVSKLKMNIAHRGAEAGGILGVTPPTFLGLHPHFLEGLKNGS